MFNKKEITHIIIAIIVISLSISVINSWKTFGVITISIFFVILLNILAKKITSNYIDADTEFRLWEIKRFGFKPQRHFKKPIPAGIIFPILISILSWGNLMWLASLVFEVKPKIYRAAKRHGLYSFSEVTEFQIGLIAASGVIINILFAIIGYLIGFSIFAKLSLWFAFFSLIPISDLDGNKIFFGSLVLWSALSSIVLIGIAYLFLVI